MGGVDRLPGRDVGSPKRRHLVPKIDTKICVDRIAVKNQQYIWARGQRDFEISHRCLRSIILLYYCFHFAPRTMAEAIAVRNLFRRFGIPANAEGDRTIAWLASQGVDSGPSLSIINDTVLKSLLKQLASDARDLPADERPLNTVVVTSAISVAIFGWCHAYEGMGSCVEGTTGANHGTGPRS